MIPQEVTAVLAGIVAGVVLGVPGGLLLHLWKARRERRRWWVERFPNLVEVAAPLALPPLRAGLYMRPGVLCLGTPWKGMGWERWLRERWKGEEPVRFEDLPRRLVWVVGERGGAGPDHFYCRSGAVRQ